MSTALVEIEAQAQNLPPNDRAELAERLIESLSMAEDAAPKAAWIALAKSRRDEIRSGRVKGIPGEEGSAMVRKLVGR
jgi:putative addiction module component (TIGR02574 family)